MQNRNSTMLPTLDKMTKTTLYNIVEQKQGWKVMFDQKRYAKQSQ